MLTNEQRTAHLTDTSKCPYCQHPELSVVNSEHLYSEWNDPIWNAQLEVTMSCNSCSQRWVKVYWYKLIDVKDYED